MVRLLLTLIRRNCIGAIAMVAMVGFGPASLLNSVTAHESDGAQESNNFDDILSKKLPWRSIGPAIMGGRIDDFAVVENNPSTIYVGAATGGVWKTTNNGITWSPIFDDQGTGSIGDITIAPSNPNIVWVGSGEANNRQSSSWGNGVYRSLDAGKTWQNMGLKDTQTIGRIVIDPHDPNTVYVAAGGHLWGPNSERGLFKTSDGGKTWAKSLYIDEDTGVTDVAIDLQSPNTLYAAAYQRRRTPWGFNGGGPHSGLYKTVDAGQTWTRLTEGLPEGVTGRIAVDVYRSNPNVVYALIENEKGGVFRSDDQGATWKRMSSTDPRACYYSQVRIDPNNDQRIWVCGAPMYISEDGGKTFNSTFVGKIHTDFHALWIDPSNSNHVLAGCDGGIHFSYDRGRSWNVINTIPLGQFYEVSYDNQKPYWVYGGLQDNGSWSGPSGTLNTEGITNDDWFRTDGGDGFYSVVDTSDPSTVYVESQNGNVSRLEMKTGERRTIKPSPPPGQPEYRFDWNTPIVISPHNNHVIFLGGNRVFRSPDRGDTWTRSDDLSKKIDRDKIQIMGALPDKHMLSRNDGQETFGEVVTLAESTMKEGLLYAGTDDGNLQVSRDGGKTWTNVTANVPGVPANTYVSRVTPSRFSEGTAYATFDGHRSDDFKPYVYMTTDYGQTWKPLRSNLPDGVTCRVIREHPRNQNLLFLGTEFGAYVSFDRGGRWSRLKGGLPMVRVDDIQIQPRENDLIVATHGRSIWILDDISALEDMTEEIAHSEFHLFPVRSGTEFRLYNRKSDTGHAWYSAPNAPYGAVIDYYLKDKPKDEVKITVSDPSGKVVRELKEKADAGINRTEWDLRLEPPLRQEPGAEGGEGFFGPPRGPRAAPGTYSIKVTAGAQSATSSVKVEEDPRIQISESDRTRWHDAQMKVYELQKSAYAARRSVQALTRQIEDLQKSLKDTHDTPESVTSALKSASEQLDKIQRRLVMVRDQSGFAGPPLPGTPIPIISRLQRISFALEGYTAPPTPQQASELEVLSKDLNEWNADYNKFVDEEVTKLNKQMQEGGVRLLNPGSKAGPSR